MKSASVLEVDSSEAVNESVDGVLDVDVKL